MDADHVRDFAVSNSKDFESSFMRPLFPAACWTSSECTDAVLTIEDARMTTAQMRQRNILENVAPDEMGRLG